MAFGYGAGAYQQVRSHGGVESADAHGLIAMLMDGAIERLIRARSHMERGEIAAKADVMTRIMDIVSELRGSLDTKVESPLVGQLSALYDYMGNRLLHANLHNDVTAVDEVHRLLKQLRDAWKQVPTEARTKSAAP
ncbi:MULTISPECIES: flagellar export chaperone FliS [Dyella]|uniref:Flagellar secretion chaperone FliS n=2 Tax=Dyella TaxID=231454 RepID=A0A4R0YRR1_9GAMM|nr:MULTISPECIES: flagellar export chaperone FliS [Dyella]TBR37193.1 flagellar export chaperone FliS [Dyella terrae]TCI07717.1 flagellar export chaperone FliS [Dyella soli]